jgi:hypothetical protein
MGTNENVAIVREVFRAIEQRDAPRLAELLDPEVHSIGRHRRRTAGTSTSVRRTVRRGPEHGCRCSRPRPSDAWTCASSPRAAFLERAAG